MVEARIENICNVQFERQGVIKNSYRRMRAALAVATSTSASFSRNLSFFYQLVKGVLNVELFNNSTLWFCER